MSIATDAFESLSVVIPAYNAEGVVCDTLDRVQTYLVQQELENEVIVVDDGSTDATAQRVSERGRGVTVIRNERNRGKGYSVQRGMLTSRCAWALFMDVDHSTSIEHLERFAPFANRAEVLIASRNLPDSCIVRAQPRLRQRMGRTFPYLVRLLALPGLSDTQCGFKVFRRAVIERVFERQRCDGFCFDVEVLLIATRLGYRIAEIPVDWHNPHESTIRLWRDPARMFADLLRIAWRHRPAVYAAKLTAPTAEPPSPPKNPPESDG
jgi:dolichyl-phosphate beta-glucosyltransferase